MPDVLVDALLDFLPQQRADTLILESGKPPILMRGSERKPLSMPGLEVAMIDDILAEVTDDVERERLTRAGEVSTTHETRAGVHFEVKINAGDSGPRLLFRKRRPKRAAAGTSAAPAPVAAAGPVVAQARADGDSGGGGGAPVIVASAPSRSRLALGRAGSSAEPELDSLLERAVLQGASDVFISAHGGVRMRVGVDLVELPDAGVDAARLPDSFAPMWAQLSPELDASGSVDFALRVGVGPGASRFRVNLFRELGGLAAVFRPIRREAPTLRSLGLGEELYTLTQYRSGLVLMSGQAGAGKSTTLVALLEQLNRTTPRHIITLEDPIEYVYPPGRALIHQREVGVHVDSFASGLRAALRESPDIILVGEMRDHETVRAALTAAETGHLVLSTLHCADAGSAVNRVIDVFPEHQQRQVREQLAASLRAVLTQHLLPGLRAPRVAAYELMRVNVPVAAKIREQRGHQLRTEIQKGRKDGMVPLEFTLARLVRERRVSEAQARRYAHDPRLLDEYL